MFHGKLGQIGMRCLKSSETLTCVCGCGGEIEVKPHYKYCGFPRFIRGHNPGRRGPANWVSSLKGKTYEEIYGEFAQKQRSKRSVIRSEEFVENLRERYKGVLYEVRYGSKKAKEIRRRQSEALFGHDVTEETKRKQSEAKKREKCYCWQGGISNLPYPFDFNKELRNLIRKRDDNTCQLCSGKENLCVHHIDYVKENLDLRNLITLCRSCNAKVNFDRDYWEEFFKRKMLEISNV